MLRRPIFQFCRHMVRDMLVDEIDLQFGPVRELQAARAMRRLDLFVPQKLLPWHWLGRILVEFSFFANLVRLVGENEPTRKFLDVIRQRINNTIAKIWEDIDLVFLLYLAQRVNCNHYVTHGEGMRTQTLSTFKFLLQLHQHYLKLSIFNLCNQFIHTNSMFFFPRSHLALKFTLFELKLH